MEFVNVGPTSYKNPTLENSPFVNPEKRVESGLQFKVKGGFQPKSYKYPTLQNSPFVNSENRVES